MAGRNYNRLYANLPSLDVVLATGVSAGCISMVASAYLEGRAPLKGSCNCLETSNSTGVDNDLHVNSGGDWPPSFRLSATNSELLSEQGYLVVDDFLSKEQVRAARAAMDWNRFHPNLNHADDEVVVRTDKVYFQKNQERLRHVNGMQAVQSKLRSVGSALVLSNFSGFKLVSNSITPGHQTYDRDRLYAPTEMQVSFYDDGGSYYNAHTDGCHDSLQEMGLLGYLRSWYLQKRYLTSIVYLNDTEREWNVNDGGCLRVFHHQSESDDAPAPRVDAETVASSFSDIQPKSGRLVLFSSKNTAHAVLPTFAPRLACCIWFTMH